MTSRNWVWLSQHLIPKNLSSAVVYRATRSKRAWLKRPLTRWFARTYGVDPTTIPHEPYNPLTPGGVGLICLCELLDHMVYEPQPDGMLATMVKRKGQG